MSQELLDAVDALAEVLHEVDFREHARTSGEAWCSAYLAYGHDSLAILDGKPCVNCGAQL